MPDEVVFDAEIPDEAPVSPAEAPEPDAPAVKRRDKAAAAMLIAGANAREIAEVLNYSSPGAARAAAERLIGQAYDPTTEYRAARELIGAQYDALLKASAPRALHSKIKDPTDKSGESYIENDKQDVFMREYRATLAAKVALFGLAAPQVLRVESPSQRELEAVVTRLAEIEKGEVADSGDIFSVDADGVYKLDGDEENA